MTVGTVSQTVYGSLSQIVKTTSQIGSGSAPVTSGTFGWNSGFSPVLVGDAANARILKADNIYRRQLQQLWFRRQRSR